MRVASDGRAEAGVAALAAAERTDVVFAWMDVSFIASIVRD